MGKNRNDKYERDEPQTTQMAIPHDRGRDRAGHWQGDLVNLR